MTRKKKPPSTERVSEWERRNGLVVLRLRIPRTLHARLKMRSHRRGQALNQLVIDALRTWDRNVPERMDDEARRLNREARNRAQGRPVL